MEQESHASASGASIVTSIVFYIGIGAAVLIVAIGIGYALERWV
jgi:hypothetical protein